MRKEEVCVLIDSEEKRLRALEILKKAGEEVYESSYLFDNFLTSANTYSIGIDETDGKWCLRPEKYGKYLITINQLEKLLLPNYVVKDVHLTIDELKEQAEKLGFELIEKKRVPKVGDFGVFYNSEHTDYYDFLIDIEDDSFVASDGNVTQNFRYLTEEEKEQIKNNW